MKTRDDIRADFYDGKLNAAWKEWLKETEDVDLDDDTFLDVLTVEEFIDCMYSAYCKWLENHPIL